MQHVTIKVILAFLTTFLAGLLVGYIIFGNQESEIATAKTEETIDARHMRERLVTYMELTEEQKEPFFQAMRAYRNDVSAEMRGFRQEEHAFLRKKYASFRSEMEDLLSDEQMLKLDRRLNPDSLRRANPYRAQSGERRVLRRGNQ